MDTLDDLQGTAIGMDDLRQATPEPVQTTPLSNQNKAAHVAMLGGEDVAEAYEASVGGLDSDDPQYSESVLSGAREESRTASNEALIQTMADPQVGQGDKSFALNANFILNQADTDFKALLKEEMIVSPSDNESDYQSKVRLTHAGRMGEEAAVQSTISQMVMTEVAKQDDFEYSQGVWDIFSLYMVPLAETTLVNEIQNKVNKNEMTPAAAVSTLWEDILSGKGVARDSLMGNVKRDLAEVVAAIPPEQRIDFARDLIGIVSTESSAMLSGDNQFAEYNLLKDVVERGYIDDTQAFFDNAASVLDIIPLLGGIAGEAGRFATRFIKPAPNPSSVIATMSNSNPGRYRKVIEAIEMDETGEAARLLAGTTREAAIVDDIAPEIGTQVGRQLLPPPPSKGVSVPPNAKGSKEMISAPIKPKVPPLKPSEARAINGNQEMVERAHISGGNQYTIAEKDAAAAMIVNKFRDVTDIRILSNSSTIGRRMGDDRVHITAVYGRRDGGFLTAADATEQVLFNLRTLGVRDQDFDIMVRGPEGYTPAADKFDAVTQGDFVAALDYKYKIAPNDIATYAHFDVKYNLFDRFMPKASLGGARLQRNVLDPASMLDPRMVQSASVAVDRAAGIQDGFMQLASEFAGRYKSASPLQKEMITEYIHEANREGLKLNTNYLSANGYDRNSIQALQKFREYWDTAYLLENMDLIRSLDANGYMVLTDGVNGSRLYAKPLEKGIYNNNRVYNPVTDEVTRLSKNELNALYESGGTVARLRAGIDDGGEIIEYIMSSNTKSDYFRKLSSLDHVLSYREGYYTVTYKNPVFVTRNVTDTKGNFLYNKAVAVAKDQKTARRMLEKLAREDGITSEDGVASWGGVRGDKKEIDIGSDDYWDLHQANGRIATRFRGKRLEDADATSNVNALDAHVEDPAQSMQRAARSLSERIAMRDWLEGMKARFNAQYGHLTPKVNGEVSFPNKWTEITKEGKHGDKELGDARTTFEYIQYMQNGYNNSLDDASKSLFRGMANAFGESSLPLADDAERMMSHLSEVSPTGLLKNSSFHAYLALNPLRQLLIQSHQGLQLLAIAPKFVMTQLPKQMASVVLYKSLYQPYLKGGKSAGGMAEARKLVEEAMGQDLAVTAALVDLVDRSGVWQAVDKTNLLQGDLTYLAESMMGSHNAGLSAMGKVTSGIRKAGFDAGERMNLLSAFLTFYNMEQKALAAAGKGGKTFDQEIVDSALGAARNFTYSMNKAGDMPYNQNMLGMVMQYQQVPHKFATTATTNRGLSKTQKLKLAAFNTLAYGVPTAAAGVVVDAFLQSIAREEDEDLRRLLMDGTEAYMLNRGLQVFDEEGGPVSRVDWGGLAPFDMYASLSFLDTMLNEGTYNVIAASPGGQLFFGKNPRITDAFKKSLSVVADIWTGSAEPKDVMQAMDAWLSISSGYSNTMRAYAAKKKGVLMNSSSTYIMDDDVTSAEAFAVALGFSTATSSSNFLVQKQIHEIRKDLEADAKVTHNELVKVLRDDGISLVDKEFVYNYLSVVQSYLPEEHKNFYLQEMLKNMSRSVKSGDGIVYLKMLEAFGSAGEDDFRRLINQTNLSDSHKQRLRGMLEEPTFEEDDD